MGLERMVGFANGGAIEQQNTFGPAVSSSGTPNETRAEKGEPKPSRPRRFLRWARLRNESRTEVRPLAAQKIGRAEDLLRSH
jgi:hypothetical protein